MSQPLRTTSRERSTIDGFNFYCRAHRVRNTSPRSDSSRPLVARTDIGFKQTPCGYERARARTSRRATGRARALLPRAFCLIHARDARRRRANAPTMRATVRVPSASASARTSGRGGRLARATGERSRTVAGAAKPEDGVSNSRNGHPPEAHDGPKLDARRLAEAMRDGTKTRNRWSSEFWTEVECDTTEPWMMGNDQERGGALRSNFLLSPAWRLMLLSDGSVTVRVKSSRRGPTNGASRGRRSGISNCSQVASTLRRMCCGKEKWTVPPPARGQMAFLRTS